MTGGAWLFLFLLLLVAVERRLSEAHFNLRSWTIGIESADALDGDEIRVRLVVRNDDKPPSLSEAGRVLVSPVVQPSTALPAQSMFWGEAGRSEPKASDDRRKGGEAPLRVF